MLQINMKNRIGQLGKGLTLLTLAGFMMGNQGCPKEQPVAERQLRRRVQMGSISSYVQTMKLPADAGGGSFNFEYAANAQLQRVLRDTKTFSTVGSFYDPSTVSKNDRIEFDQCSASSPAQAFEFSDEAMCMANLPQAKINAFISNFQFIGGAQADIGFDKLGSLTGLMFNFKKARLDMEFEANDPLIQGQQGGVGLTKAAVHGQSYFNDVGGKVSLDFGMIKLGLGGYLASDMAKVVEKAMASGLVDLRKDWDSNDSSMGLSGGWYAMVMKNCDSGIMINAGNGADAGLVKGDIVAIYDMGYQWAGAICNSQLIGAVPSTDEPIAYAVVTSLGDTISRAKIIEGDANYPRSNIKVKPGARVYMKKWVPVAAAPAVVK